MRVALQAGQACGRCAGCIRGSGCREPLTRGLDYDGGWAQYALAREDTLAPIPDHLPFDQAAIIPDAVSTPYATIVETGAVRPAQAVGIWLWSRRARRSRDPRPSVGRHDVLVDVKAASIDRVRSHDRHQPGPGNR
jgi:NADPH:quinone reductase-like Zn-dependent oxidoreductase